MNEADKQRIVFKASRRVLQNMSHMDAEGKLAYVQKILSMLDDRHLIAFDFAIEMTPTEEERKSYE